MAYLPTFASGLVSVAALSALPPFVLPLAVLPRFRSRGSDPAVPPPHGLIVPTSITCALGVPGNMSHGSFPDGFSLMPVVAVVAPGM